MTRRLVMIDTSPSMYRVITAERHWGTMKVLTEIRLRSGQIIGPVIGACLMFYFIYHAIQGDRGLIAFWQLSKQITQAKNIYLTISRKRAEIENRVMLINPNSLNSDMLEERARFMLGYTKPGEIVVFLNKNIQGPQ